MTVEIKGLGKITASKEVLNTISVYMFDAGHHYGSKGYKNRQLKVIEEAIVIHDELSSKGY